MKLVVCVINYILAYIGVLTELFVRPKSCVHFSCSVEAVGHPHADDANRGHFRVPGQRNALIQRRTVCRLDPNSLHGVFSTVSVLVHVHELKWKMATLASTLCCASTFLAVPNLSQCTQF